MVGNSGSGKTTLGRALAERLGLPFVELDSIYHQADWQPLEREEFRARVAAMVAGDGWVLDGSYSAVRDLIWARADTIVYFDLPRLTATRQVLVRTLRRGLTRQELWNGNREQLRNLLRLDPELSILRWTWIRHEKHRRRYREAAADPQLSHIRFVRIASRTDATRLLSTVSGAPGDGPGGGPGGGVA